LCLKKIKGLSKVHLVDAGFVWTEPHSKRIKVKLTVQKEVFGGAILQQTFIVEFVVNNQMCDDCRRREAKDYWRSVVQVRQKTFHKKTFLYMEQLILKHKAHVNAVQIKEHPDGIDFFFATKGEAKKLVDFLMNVAPCRSKSSQELVSHDPHNNVYNYKTTFSVEVVPVCKDNIVCLSSKLSRQLGNFGPLAVCFRVTTGIQLIDPQTLKVMDISSSVFWRTPFSSLCSPRQLTEFFVLQIEPLFAKYGGSTKEKFQLADVWVVKSNEVGVSNTQIHTRTHLGHLLNPGDTALGFDFTTSNINDDNFEQLKPKDLPDVILVKKTFADRKRRSQHRNWKLRVLQREREGSVSDSHNGDFDEFMEDLEEDSALRKHVNIYFDPKKPQQVGDPDMPRIGIEEMLHDLSLGDPDPEGAMAMAMD
jgi:nonsense-mediated mRNA decay protein 3